MDNKLAEAEEILGNFWGTTKSNGGAEAFAQCRTKLEALKLGKKDLRELRIRLPFAEVPGGIVAGRVKQLKELLEHLEG